MSVAGDFASSFIRFCSEQSVICGHYRSGRVPKGFEVDLAGHCLEWDILPTDCRRDLITTNLFIEIKDPKHPLH